MTIELMIGIAIGYIPCKCSSSRSSFTLTSSLDVDNFGQLISFIKFSCHTDPSSAHIGGFVMGLFTGIIFYPIISESKRHKTIAWAFKIAAIPAAVILFVLLVKNFYTSDPYAGMEYSHLQGCV